MTEIVLTLLAVLLSLGCYLVALMLFTRAGKITLLHPLLVTALLVFALLWSLDIPVSSYQSHSQVLYWLLGPATVALAVPVYQQWQHIRQSGKAIWAIVLGGTLSPLLAVVILALSPVEIGLIKTMISKSVTTPLAMETTEIIGGYPQLAAVFVITSGLIGALFAKAVFAIGNIHSDKAQGIALGTVSHAVGTSRALQLGAVQGAFSSVALCINGVLTAILIPIFWWLLT